MSLDLSGNGSSEIVYLTPERAFLGSHTSTCLDLTALDRHSQPYSQEGKSDAASDYQPTAALYENEGTQSL